MYLIEKVGYYLALLSLIGYGTPLQSCSSFGLLCGLLWLGCIIDNADRKVEIDFHFINDSIHWIG